MLVLTKGINNHGSELENFSSHISRSSRESTPVSKDHHRESFLGEVTNSLGGLVGRVGEKDLSSLRKNSLTRVGVGRIGRNNLLDLTSLNSNGTHGNTSKTSTPNDNSLTPTSKISFSSHHGTWIIRSGCRTPLDLTINRIRTI